MDITVKRTLDRIRSCNLCHAQNYDSHSILNKKVDTLYDVQIGSMLCCLCMECLEQLNETVSAFVEQEKGRA